MSPPAFVQTQGEPEIDLDHLTAVAVGALRLARRMGIATPSEGSDCVLPYSLDNDKVVFDAPHLGWLLNKNISFLRGWTRFESCIKGYNALGLIAEQVMEKHRSLVSTDTQTAATVCRDFLLSRETDGVPCFSTGEVEALSDDELLTLDLFDVAIWQTLSGTRVVCSTSSNLGISLHDALRALQRAPIHHAGKSFTVLNGNEGALTIWCPDKGADFMNREKSEFLRFLETEQPPLTTLRTYFNRQERDPGALADALETGGYFFPTNPQSPAELQNLLYFALSSMASTRVTVVQEVLKLDSVANTLRSLGCEISGDSVLVRKGVEGGLGGLMLPYLLLAEEVGDLHSSISVWNQASIGAALAGAVLADQVLRQPDLLTDHARFLLEAHFPTALRAFSTVGSRAQVKTSIHGVFDLANIQSLAQLLGVVVRDHLSGKGSAYVGLGSASYSNGNRCFEILSRDDLNGGPFRGKDHFHPATHALNPVAQALVFGEELARVRRLHRGHNQDLFAAVRVHCKKPEPAGAAALAGYLLTRLDRGSLSSVQIVHALRLLGYDRELFLHFAGFAEGREGEQAFIQRAQDEGLRMSTLAVELMTLLDWPIEMLRRHAVREASPSFRRDLIDPIDPPSLEVSSPLVVLYLTGDNTFQPNEDFVQSLITNQVRNEELLAAAIRSQVSSVQPSVKWILRLDSFMIKFGLRLVSLENRFQALRTSLITRLAERTTM